MNFSKSRKVVLAGLFSIGMIGISAAKDGNNDGGFGLKGGVGFSTLSFGEPKDVESFNFKNNKNTWKVGGMVGVTYEKRFGDHFALDIEALLANKGVKRQSTYSILGKDGKFTLKGNLFSLDVPVSAKFYLGDNFNIYAGPYFLYIMGGAAKFTHDFDGKTQTKNSSNWYGDDYKDINGELPMNRFDLGANVGLEFVSNGGFGVGARFQKGFLDLTNNDYKGTLTESDGLIMGDKKFVSNTGFQVYTLIRF
ncbi:MAG: PorT family protein [Chitinophagales bacterium]|nr:PorT family protein [Chitinophagales bacterium]